MKILQCLLIIATLSCFADGPTTSDAKALGKQLMKNLPGIFSLDKQYQEKMGGRRVPAIRNGNWILSAQGVSLIDSFAQDTGTVATLFVKVDDEFVRLETTETKEKPGSILSHGSPAYKYLLGELRYTGQVTLAGQDYMADYDVFRDRQGRVIGAYLVGIPIGAQ